RGKGRGGKRGISGGGHQGVVANAARGEERSTNNECLLVPMFTPNQVQCLLSLIKSTPSRTDKLLGKAHNNLDNWLLDSGASHHPRGKQKLLTHVVDTEACPVSLPDVVQTSAIK
ncbi:hypothetical protein Ancab_014940, partial [Ancistrocladus abbreviatus]